MEINWKEHFTYKDGKLYWTHTSPNGACQPGKLAGYRERHHNRWVVGLHGKAYKRARIVWEMHHGEIPSGCVIDHINRNREDDRIDNLRAVPVTLNNRNKTIDKRNSSGVPGVTYDAGRKRWAAYVNRDGKQVRLGRFPSLEEAAAARAAAANSLGYLEV